MYLIKTLILSLVLFSSNMMADIASRIQTKTQQKMHTELAIFNLKVGNPVLIRTFKKESRLELWIQKEKSKTFKLFKTYPICYYSGGLGPKQHQGDKVTPEGFYYINTKGLNPYSRFHLSMNINYPNHYDRQLGRTGSLIMIHGACDAVGCFAMSNPQIEEIYYLVEAALRHGQKRIDVHSFPFHMTAKNLSLYKKNKWYRFWQQLAVGYQLFNQTHQSLTISTQNKHYVVSAQ